MFCQVKAPEDQEIACIKLNGYLDLGTTPFPV